jgi:phosphohistidine swiveling domain-containing protein
MSAEELRAALFTMSEEPYALVAERSLLEMAIASTHDTLTDEAIDAHVHGFHWKATNYERAVSASKADVRLEVHELAQNNPVTRLDDMAAARQDSLARKSRGLQIVPRRTRTLALLADQFGSTMADRRKAVMNESLVGLAAISAQIASDLSIDAQDLAMFSPTELRSIASRPELVPSEAMSRRRAYVQVLSPSPLDEDEMRAAIEVATGDHELAPRAEEPAVADGELAEKRLAELDHRMALFVHVEDMSTVYGEVVDVAGLVRTRVSGPCRVVRDPLAQRPDFVPGEILIASSTTPDFVPIMRTAAGIVTNMGGMLQHAAHFAREQAMPCIVGTGFATSAFATGEVVTLDLETGVVTRADDGEK